ncbi:MAG TPA: nucleotidyltransferase family protein [Acidimicrobiales bacterium]|nr:nucleotidyltransferase family protein [Acidimicrobiales bacterium]
MRPTGALMWAACRLEPDAPAVADAVARGADLDLAADQAVAQRVAPLLWRALEAAGCADRETTWGERLHGDTMRCRAHAVLVLPRIADALLRPLTSAGFEPLVLKGGVLAERYPAPGLRPMDDVDVLLPAAQHPAALDVLARAGWMQVSSPPGRHHEVLLTHPELPGTPLELHHDLTTWRQRSSRLGADQLWADRQPQVVQGAPAFGLRSEVEMLLVASHAAKPFHVFGRLLWIVDLLAITKGAAADGKPIDWNLLESLADEAGCRTALAVALQQATRLGLESPASARRLLATGTRLAALEPVLSPEWPVANHDWPTRHRLGYALVDDRKLRLTLFAGAVTEKGLPGAPFRALTTTSRAIRRWWRLQRAIPASDAAGREDLEEPVKP